MAATLAHERTIGSKGHGLFGMKGAQLPAYIQHVYNDLVESGKHSPGGRTYALAIGIVKNWARGHTGGKGTPSAETVAKARAAIEEWNKLKAQAHARTAAKSVKEEELYEAAADWIEERRTALQAAAELVLREQEELLEFSTPTVRSLASKRRGLSGAGLWDPGRHPRTASGQFKDKQTESMFKDFVKQNSEQHPHSALTRDRFLKVMAAHERFNERKTASFQARRKTHPEEFTPRKTKPSLRSVGLRH